MDTGAALSLLTAEFPSCFQYEWLPTRVTRTAIKASHPLTIGGANGTFEAMIDDPVGLYAGGLQGVTSTSPLTINHSVLKGQTNTSLATMPDETGLPNIARLAICQPVRHVYSQ